MGGNKILKLFLHRSGVPPKFTLNVEEFERVKFCQYFLEIHNNLSCVKFLDLWGQEVLLGYLFTYFL